MKPFSDALYQQCVKRVRALAAKSRSNPTPAQITYLARRIAQITEQNVSRIPQNEVVPPYAATPFPDSYIDEIIATFLKEAPLFDKLRSGDTETWDGLHRQIHHMVSRRLGYRFTSGFVGDMGLYCTVVVWLKLSSYPFDTPFMTWVRKIIFYELSTFRKSADYRVETALSLDAPVDSEPDSVTHLDQLADSEQAEEWHRQELIWTIRSCMKYLSADQQEIVELELAGHDTIGIATAMNRKPENVYTLRYRTYKKLRTLIQASC